MAYMVAHWRAVKGAAGLVAVTAHNSREKTYDEKGAVLEDRKAGWFTHPENRNLNYGNGVLADGVNDLRKAVIDKAGVKRKPQKNAAVAFECVISASPDWFLNNGEKDTRAFFADALTFLKKKYGAENLLQWAVHLDETTPHMHTTFVPIVSQEGQTKKYSSGAFLGGKEGLARFQSEIWEACGKRRGIERGLDGSSARHTNAAEWKLELTKKNRVLVEKETALATREKTLGDFDKKLKDKQKTLSKWRNIEKALTDRENALTAKEGKLAEVVKAFDERLRGWRLPPVEKKLFGTESAEAYRNRIHPEVLGKIARALNGLDKNAEKEKTLSERETKISEKENALTMEKQAVLQKETALAQMTPQQHRAIADEKEAAIRKTRQNQGYGRGR